MADVKNLLLATAGAAGGAGLNVEQVFRSSPYTGNGSTNAIVNNIDISGEGGLVWLKRLNSSQNHCLFDTVRGGTQLIRSDATFNQNNAITSVTFNNNGFTIGNGNERVNNSSDSYCGWTFRKAPKFFDVVTYTGDGGTNRTIAHSIGSTPGFIAIKCTNDTGDWVCFHRKLNGGTNPHTFKIKLNEAEAQETFSNNEFGNSSPTASVFGVGGNLTNKLNNTYVAYIFAHNDGDGDFGETGDQDIIKCGGFTGNGTSQEINLGFEPQFIIWRCTTQQQDWNLVDDMRGLGFEKSSKDDYRYVRPNGTNQEGGASGLTITSTGFAVSGSGQAINGGSENYIFIAIRRDMATPTSRAEVYDISQNFISSYSSVGNRVDMVIGRSNQTTQNWRAFSRYYGTGFLRTEDSAAISYLPDNEVRWNSHDGFYQETNGTPNIWWQWKRAPKFFDMVDYIGNNTARTISHNLGVAPEMMWIKKITASGDWLVYHTGLTNNNHYIVLNSGADEEDFGSGMWNNTAPTDSVFSIGSHNHPNANNAHYVAYLFASLDGISKIGTYNGNGSSTGPTIDCGFSSGPKWVMIKRLDAGSNDHWAVFDTTRGLSSGNDFYIAMSNTDAEFSNVDWIDPTNAGFQVVNTNSAVNDGSSKYIFYAIAA